MQDAKENINARISIEQLKNARTRLQRLVPDPDVYLNNTDILRGALYVFNSLPITDTRKVCADELDAHLQMQRSKKSSDK